MVEKEFRKPSVVEEELKLLRELQAAAEDKKNPNFKIVQTIESFEKRQQEIASGKHEMKDHDNEPSVSQKSRVTMFMETQDLDRLHIDGMKRSASGGTRHDDANGSANLLGGNDLEGTISLQSLTQKAYRMYLDALLHTGNIAQFFIISIRLMTDLQGFDSSRIWKNPWMART
ncbi:hypothetical protein RFI_33446 [Reticulomyxa filosa]|uniref:Uncharacterized protein n=1 Tax=Reticulomyxa filosa TaxID=46433 RepID=X6LRE1_RETFI|nr:hypothetical protein RFI_33446 [Reticulomyxa filosa]|eukprot:ETO03956.1 hypothetical protein RFI_33446 [Reticulomyxa filosa]